MNQSEYLQRLQETALRLQNAPLADAVGTCIAELRTPLTAIFNYGQLLAMRLPYPENCRVLIDIIVQQSKTIIDVHIADELADFLQDHLPQVNQAQPGALVEPTRHTWNLPIDGVFLHITHNIRDAGTRIRRATEQFQMLCASQPSPETSDYMMEIGRSTERLLVVVDLLLEGLLLARIRRECMDNT